MITLMFASIFSLQSERSIALGRGSQRHLGRSQSSLQSGKDIIVRSFGYQTLQYSQGQVCHWVTES